MKYEGKAKLAKDLIETVCEVYHFAQGEVSYENEEL
jgi:hypothetical protein